MGQGSLFSREDIASMRDRTRSKNYSAARDELRREHERNRAWGLQRRHAEKLRRLHQSGSGPAADGNRTPPAPPVTGAQRVLPARESPAVETPTRGLRPEPQAPQPAVLPPEAPQSVPPAATPEPVPPVKVAESVLRPATRQPVSSPVTDEPTRSAAAPKSTRSSAAREAVPSPAAREAVGSFGAPGAAWSFAAREVARISVAPEPSPPVAAESVLTPVTAQPPLMRRGGPCNGGSCASGCHLCLSGLETAVTAGRAFSCGPQRCLKRRETAVTAIPARFAAAGMRRKRMPSTRRPAPFRPGYRTRPPSPPRSTRGGVLLNMGGRCGAVVAVSLGAAGSGWVSDTYRAMGGVKTDIDRFPRLYVFVFMTFMDLTFWYRGPPGVRFVCILRRHSPL
jgi:hypothetical protein